MQPAIVRHGLELANPKTLYEEGRREADAMSSMTWAEFLKHVHEDYPAFNDEFDQLLRLAARNGQGRCAIAGGSRAGLHRLCRR
jgi:hypothetical protein